MPRARDFLTLGRDWFATISHFSVFGLSALREVAIRSRGNPPDPGSGPGGQPLPWSGHIRAAREWPTYRVRWWAARDTIRTVRDAPGTRWGLRPGVPL